MEAPLQAIRYERAARSFAPVCESSASTPPRIRPPPSRASSWQSRPGRHSNPLQTPRGRYEVRHHHAAAGSQRPVWCSICQISCSCLPALCTRSGSVELDSRYHLDYVLDLSVYLRKVLVAPLACHLFGGLFSVERESSLFHFWVQ